ncbi:MAG: hypothetical protein K2V38_02420, partial [Gemmataceae bacterium]|nr:hypothetical protein [Gemmataceae bacterium]
RVLAAVPSGRAAERPSVSPRRTARQFAAVAALAALAAAVVVAAFVIAPAFQKMKPDAPVARSEPAPTAPEVAPLPRPKPPELALAPDPRPIRAADGMAKVEALLDSPKPLLDTVAAAPKLLDAVARAFAKPAPEGQPKGDMLEPARKSLTELPDAARHGLEPVTGTAQKAYARLLRDLGSVKPKPNS